MLGKHSIQSSVSWPLSITFQIRRFFVRGILASVFFVTLLSGGCTTVAPANFKNPIVRITFPAWISETDKLEALKKEAASRANLLCGQGHEFQIEQVSSTQWNFVGINAINGFIRCKEKASELSNKLNSAPRGASGQPAPTKKNSDDDPYKAEERMRPVRP